MDFNEITERLLRLEREAEERKRLDEKLRIADRVDDIERLTANLDGKDMTPDAPKAGVFAELQGPMKRRDAIETSMLPFEIEFGVPSTNIVADSATVTLRPVNGLGVEYTAASNITVYVANDRKKQSLVDRGWIKKVIAYMVGTPVFGDPESTVTASGTPFTEAMAGQWLSFTTSGNSYLIETYTSTSEIDITGDASSEQEDDEIIVSGDILSFIRFSPWVAGSPNVGGVLIGEARGAHVPTGLIAEFEGFGADIPSGWTLCDGGLDSKGIATPNLSGKFVVGYYAGDPSTDYDTIGNTGGFKLHGPTENEHAKYQSYSVTSGAAFAYWDRTIPAGDLTDVDNRPPYYTLAFIRKD